jgi:hypothetical protein
MPTHLLEGYFQLPAHNKPADDLLRISVNVGTKESLCLELSFRITHQSTQRIGTAYKPVEYQTDVSDAISTVRTPLPYQLATVMGFQRVEGSWATSERLGKRSPFPLCAASLSLSGTTCRSTLVECGVQPKTSDEGDRLSQLAAASKELQGSVSAIGDGHDLALWIPAPY